MQTLRGLYQKLLEAVHKDEKYKSLYESFKKTYIREILASKALETGSFLEVGSEPVSNSGINQTQLFMFSSNKTRKKLTELKDEGSLTIKLIKPEGGDRYESDFAYNIICSHGNNILDKETEKNRNAILMTLPMEVQNTEGVISSDSKEIHVMLETLFKKSGDYKNKQGDITGLFDGVFEKYVIDVSDIDPNSQFIKSLKEFKKGNEKLLIEIKYK